MTDPNSSQSTPPQAEPQRTPRRWVWLQVLLALVLIFEEWGWEPLQRLLARLGQWPGFRWLESTIRRLPPYAALGLFLLPTVLLLPVKLGALWLMTHGHKAWGLAVIVLAKLVGTAVVARLFALTHATLMQLPWFARLYGRWMTWKTQLLNWVRNSPAWTQWTHTRLKWKHALLAFRRQCRHAWLTTRRWWRSKFR